MALLREKDYENLDKEIYRYIDLRSFFEIIGRNKYYVSRKRNFPDHYEKGAHIGFYYFINRFEPVPNPFREEYEKMWHEMGKNERLIQNCPISCWSLSGGDDYYRWSCNEKYPITICIGTTVRSFIDALDVSSPFFAGEVKYRDKATGNPDEMALFSKKEVYRCEREFRFCFPDGVQENEERDGILLMLKTVDWIKTIHIGTLVNRDLARSFFHFLQTIPTIKDRVYLSCINEDDEEEKKKKKKGKGTH